MSYAVYETTFAAGCRLYDEKGLVRISYAEDEARKWYFAAAEKAEKRHGIKRFDETIETEGPVMACYYLMKAHLAYAKANRRMVYS